MGYQELGVIPNKAYEVYRNTPYLQGKHITCCQMRSDGIPGRIPGNPFIKLQPVLCTVQRSAAWPALMYR